MTTDTRQEFVLLSDVLGVSMLVIGINHRARDGATESTVFGPFFVADAPELANGADLGAGAPGRPCLMGGRILDTRGEPIAGARIDVWQADEHGLYDVQYEGLEAARGRGRLRCEADGRSGSGPSSRSPIRSRPMARPAICCARAGATPCVRPTSTSGSPPRGTRR
jgi:hydroxyquinol 1,2-dioxygenase